MKRVNAIVKAKDAISEIFIRKADRILRNVDSAIACAKDNADEAKEAAEDIMNSLGEVASKTDTEAFQEKLNLYAAKCEEVDRWTAYVGYFEKLKAALNEDVAVEK